MRITIYTFIIFLLSGCAGMVNPSGGKKDEKTPELVKTNLTPTHFNENEIRLNFNENVEIENGVKTFTIQPKHTTFSVSGSNRNIKIKLDSSLKPNTTYILDISGGIKDVNEGNLYSMRYIFSTGEQIDTNLIAYKVLNDITGNIIKIGLTNSATDSLQNIKFDYLYRFNAESITIKGLGNNNYKCWVFTDKNDDDKPDEYAPVYYDTITPNSLKSISLDPWTDYSNKKFKEYRRQIKIFKPICDPSSYGNTDIIYIDKDSALFNAYNNDTLPHLDLKKELSNKISDRILGIRSPKEYQIIIDKCGIRNLSLADKIPFREDLNYIYINSKVKTDSINFYVKVNTDSIPFCIKKISYSESNKISSLKIQKGSKKEQIIMAVYMNEKLISIKKIDRENDAVFYMQPGTYKLLFYNTDSFLETSFDLKKLQRVKCKKIENEIILKPNWDEVLQVNFD